MAVSGSIELNMNEVIYLCLFEKNIQEYSNMYS